MQHIADDELEACALGRLKEPELAGIEEHLLVCAECQERLEEEQRIVEAIRAALRQMAPHTEIRLRGRLT